MQFALVNDVRSMPKFGMSGTCPSCGGPMIAKCGAQRVHHWAHRGERACDSWWEPETHWHRAWKNRFPAHWQEVIQHDHYGEKHIADVRTEHGVVIEFQHSHLGPEERAAREKFYGNMLWIVDGARLKRDVPRFVDKYRSLRPTPKEGLFSVPFPEEVFPKDWLGCSVPVLFDFRGDESDAGEMAWLTRSLWCLLPGRALEHAVTVALRREDFVRIAQGTAHPIQSRGILDYVAKHLAEQRRAADDEYLAGMLARQQILRRHKYRRRYARF